MVRCPLQWIVLWLRYCSIPNPRSSYRGLPTVGVKGRQVAECGHVTPFRPPHRIAPRRKKRPADTKDYTASIIEALSSLFPSESFTGDRQHFHTRLSGMLTESRSHDKRGLANRPNSSQLTYVARYPGKSGRLTKKTTERYWEEENVALEVVQGCGCVSGHTHFRPYTSEPHFRPNQHFRQN